MPFEKTHADLRHEMAQALFVAARATGRCALEEPEAKRLFALWGIAVPPGVRVGVTELVAPHLAGLSPPFALKLIAPGVLHKSDLGGVALALADAAAVEEVRRAMRSSPTLAGQPVTAFSLRRWRPRDTS